MSGTLQPNTHKQRLALVSPINGWPREIVVDHGDGTVSLLANVPEIRGAVVRGRRAGDVLRELIAS
ncbi:hypothetical protein HU230_0007960 [Bradyrhizobium quebecense]|uniref:Uncharacterized protein n=1 Tax=Bradyrhizobium quebecense TaxID=2748629 RepID=A0A973WSV1_9BRAD|nr:hypothetical protein [Bradyrhizobium quebecense]UGA45961.1 hypothetical protein HU230_0007960 [Bradyrhizobium quebecense]